MPKGIMTPVVEQPVTMVVGSIEHKDYVRTVERRIKAIMMCKRGVVETEILERQRVHQKNRPEFTKAELDAIAADKAKVIKKAMTPTAAMIKSCKNDVIDIARKLSEKARKAVGKAAEHPGMPAWRQAGELLEQERAERIATIDGDERDAIDNFTLGIYTPADLKKVLDQLEASEY